ncbi:hypothetical protein Pcinc_034832 [Petrolisthes cinctipes]|uniref:Uncharacterized protein n=1 Tax=Petrolisthes cinctipes TaxID=88211 RepID=A0AAE1C0V8_PETCI|nr:hypothetical protein Pcinc_034832 [Petrolisthes cinctipes]
MGGAGSGGLGTDATGRDGRGTANLRQPLTATGGDTRPPPAAETLGGPLHLTDQARQALLQEHEVLQTGECWPELLMCLKRTSLAVEILRNL